jgi:hypothetical protein
MRIITAALLVAFALNTADGFGIQSTGGRTPGSLSLNVKTVQDRDIEPWKPSLVDVGKFALSAVIFTALTFNQPALAQAADEPIAVTRSTLMDSIKSNKSEQEVIKIMDQVVALDPAHGRGATLSEDLSGEWKLVWSAKADGFSPLLKLPKPLKPDSYQYLGSPAAEEVGAERVAQGLTGGILGPTQFWLSSGVAPSSEDPSVLDILPPFRFQVGGRYQSGTPKTTIVEAGSDADFRKVNVRNQAAQQAPKNEYQQLYLERNGPGSIRISTVREGDPVIVGAIFVHQKM